MTTLRPAHLGVLLMLATVSCSDREPTAPTPQDPPPTAGAPGAAFSLTVDTLGSREALAGVSEVTVDAAASTGTALQFRVDFGDGTQGSESLARHIYATPGTYRVTLTVTDQRGQSATATRDVVVASPIGLWVHSGYLSSIGRVEVRAVAITTQEGPALRGTLTKDGTARTPFTGSIGGDRRMRLVIEGTSETLEGLVPSVISGDGVTWPLSLRGRASTDESLVFRRVAGEPSGAPPDADLRMRFFSFSAPYAIKQISPVLFDGSVSRGDGLTYFIEFGDGQIAQTSTATHPLDREGTYTARLTVVDRFGRSDSESLTFKAYSLNRKRLVLAGRVS